MTEVTGDAKVSCANRFPMRASNKDKVLSSYPTAQISPRVAPPVAALATQLAMQWEGGASTPRGAAKCELDLINDIVCRSRVSTLPREVAATNVASSENVIAVTASFDRCGNV